MTTVVAFTPVEKTTHNSHKFGFTLSPNNYGYWKAMIQPFLVTNNLFGYVDGTIPCPPMTIPGPSSSEKEAATAVPPPQSNPNYTAWVSNDAHVRMLITSTISKASFQHVQGITSRDLWLSLERAYAPHTSSREYTLKTQLLKLEMKPDETSSAYLTRAQEYADALANIGEPMKEKDLVMLVISGLREEYNGLKSTLLGRQFPTAFAELHGLLSDHDYMIKKFPTEVSLPQAFTAVTNNRNSAVPTATHPVNTQPAQAFYTNRSGNSRGRGSRRGRGNYNRGQGGGNRNQFSWASNQNTVFGSCNRCGIGHIPSHCPNRDPATMRTRQPPSANFTEYRSQGWLPDTGSSHHVAPDLSSFDNSEAYYGEDNLHVGNGKGLPILHIGSSHLYSPNKTFSLKDILHVPDIKQNLLSVQKFCLDNHVYFEFHSTFFVVKDKFTHTILLMGPSNGGLYSFRLPQTQPVQKMSFSTARASSTTWHQRLGHPHPQLLKFMLSTYSLPLQNKCSSVFCDSCSIGKSSKLHLLPSTYKSSHILDLVFCDVWGPAPVPSFDGHNYFLLCVDHYSRFMWIFPLKLKSDVYATFKRFLAMVERHFHTKLKSVQTDWGGEFRNLSQFFSPLGITHRLSCPHTSEQNGFVERRHRHVVETGLTLLAQSHVPQRFWHFAFDTAVYLINRMPSRTNSNTSPFEHVFKHKPDFSFLRVFGCQCYPHLRPYNKHKMDFRSTPCVFLGYSTTHHGYRCYDPQSDRIYVARHVRFNEQSFPFQINIPSPPTPTPTSPNPYVSTYPNTDLPPTYSPSTGPTAQSVPQETTPTTTLPNDPPTTQPPLVHTYHRRSKATKPLSQPAPTDQTTTEPPPQPSPPPSSTTAQPTRTRPPNLRPNPKKTQPYNASSYHTQHPSPDTEPTSFTIANRYPQWRNAMAEEYSALMRNGTWTLVPRVPNSNVVDSKWVYKLKRDQTGAIKRYKARLVARGFRQQPGIDYQETFSPVVKSTTIRVVLSLAGSKTDPSLFIYSDRGTILYMLVYVDDIILTGNNPEAIDNVVQRLSQSFAVQDMGRLSYFLGIEVASQGHDMILSQRKYILELLQRAGLSNAKLVSSPMTTNANLALGDSATLADPVKYRQIVGALQYVTLSRPDITFAVNKVCQFMHSPTENHWTAVKHILRYLQGTADYGLRILHDSGTILHAYTDSAYNSLTGFSDADWAGCPDDRRSTGGYAIYLGSNLVSWSARKQRTVSRSSTESEYKALADTVAELTWLQTLLRELRVPVQSIPTLWCDNLGATYLSANPVFHARTKHVEVDFHFVREMVAQRKLSIQFISTDDQIADVFTKPLPSQRFLLLRSKLQNLNAMVLGRDLWRQDKHHYQKTTGDGWYARADTYVDNAIIEWQGNEYEFTRLCGPPLTKICPGDEVPPATSNSKSGKEGTNDLQIWFYIGEGTGFANGYWIACGTLLLNRHRRHAFFYLVDFLKDWIYVRVVVFS
ncbi:hypothetical protein OSB04_017534 [Centaurea solstitialis]|uniref:Integrase catalytic domain-containing protein n=1 Tax=Centaurea solstitialis TaxID=347529 RepID=A0AA38WKT5_9ASTR|nr:hypothetical protein OSB04_017534 [Centaurea solstitialis]